MPGVSESLHMGHPDFRIGGRIFATLGCPDARSAMVKLSPEQQDMATSVEPAIFTPLKSAWGRRGSTLIPLQAADARTAASAISMAWTNHRR